jgi:hypothetical protein
MSQERYESITLPSTGSLPGIPGSHAPGAYIIDWETRTIAPQSTVETVQETPPVIATPHIEEAVSTPVERVAPIVEEPIVAMPTQTASTPIEPHVEPATAPEPQPEVVQPPSAIAQEIALLEQEVEHLASEQANSV